MKLISLKRTQILSASVLTLALFNHSAQLSASEEDGHSHTEIHNFDPYVVNATLAPRSIRDMLNPSSVVANDVLAERMAATLGQVLDGQAGVHSTAFGAGASRPVIRGLDGVRLRTMESGVDTGDLSADSPDHAVSIEPFFVERIEVLRGASTLLYGSSAIGGVVNAIDKRIPRTQTDGQATFEAFTDYNSASEGWTFGGLATVPFDDFVIAVSYLDRDHDDYSIPGYAEHDHGAHEEDDDHEDEEEVKGTLENSFVENQIGSVALTWFASEQTRYSLAYTSTESTYGVPGHAHGEHEEEHEDEDHDEHGEEEESIYIDLKQSVVDFEFEHQVSGSWLQSIEGRLRVVDYEHQEIEGDAVGTDFDRNSWEARASATHLVGDDAPGAFGVQLMGLDSNAVGEESYTPESETMDAAVFLLQEWHFDSIRLEGGIRLENREIDVAEASDYSDWAFSGSVGAKFQFGENWSLGTMFNHAERHPVAAELYAFGSHAATRQFEIGDPTLGVETANGFDIGLYFDSELLSASLTPFYTDFSNFIFAAPTDQEEDGFTVYRYTDVDVEFMGVESEITLHAWHHDSGFLDLSALLDYVETDISGSDENLPRIPPLRLGGAVHFGSDWWSVRTTVLHSFEQDETARFEEETEAYTQLSASLILDLPFGKGDWHLTVSGKNLLNEEIRSHTSPLKELAPAPTRHVRVNLAVAF